MADEAVQVKIGAEFGGLQEGLNQARTAVDQFSSGLQDTIPRAANSASASLDQVGSAASHLAGMMGVSLSAAGLVQIGREAMASATLLENLSESTGLTTDQLQNLNYATAGTEMSFESMGRMMTMLAKRMEELRSGGGQVAGALAGLGIDVAAFQSASLYDALTMVGEAILRAKQQGRDMGEVLGKVSEILGGRMAVNMVPVLEHMAEMKGHTEGLLKSSKEELDYLHSWETTLGRAAISMGVLAEKALVYGSAMLMGGPGAAAEIYRGKLEAGSTAAPEFAAEMAQPLVPDFQETVNAAKFAYAQEIQAGRDAAAARVEFESKVRDATIENFGAESKEAADASLRVAEAEAAAAREVTRSWDEAAHATMENVRRMVSEREAELKKELAEANAINQASFKGEEEIERARLDLERAQIEQRHALGLTSKGQEIAEFIDLENRRYGELQRELAAELSLYSDNEAKKVEVQKRMDAEAQVHAANIVRLETQAAKQTESVWGQALGGIERSFTTLFGLVDRGSSTTIRGFMAIVQAASAIRSGVQSIREGFVALHALDLKQIGAAAATAAANTYAAVSAIPIIGPFLAPPAAAAAFAAVMAYQAFISAEGGAVIGNYGALAQLHPRETVLPASLSEGLQKAITGGRLGERGGGRPSVINVHYNVSTVDATGMDKLIERHGPSIAREVARRIRAGDSHLHGALR